MQFCNGRLINVLLWENEDENNSWPWPWLA